jgi:6-phosphogluconolactonase (cycloisomerase 2 family)
MAKLRIRAGWTGLLAATFALALGAPAQARQNLGRGAVYVMSNLPDGNSVLAFQRASDGRLHASGTYGTGGLGNGAGIDPLRSQSGLVLSNSRLFAVNAASNDLSVLAVGKRGLTLVQRIASGGTTPTSVTVWRDLLYVLNAGSGEITGFRIGADGKLTALAGSTRSLTGGTAAQPSQVAFAPGGHWLVVTERGPQNLDLFRVGDDGLLDGPTAVASNGPGPFGFAFDNHADIVVSEAGAAAASSYRIGADGIELVTGSLATGEAATCWLTLTGHHVYVANAGTKTISRFRVDGDGVLMLEDAHAALVDGTPLDMAVAGNGRFLYVSLENTGGLAAFRIGADGALTPIDGVSGLPPFFQGIAAQ